MSSKLNAALRYAEVGYSVFPCEPNGKRPSRLVPHGVKEATTDPEVIRKWWTSDPEANIGIATGASGVIVVDLDKKGDKDGLTDFVAILDEQDHNAKMVVRTPSGGLHYYYRATQEVFKASAGLGDSGGIDIRSGNTYILAPESVIDGKPYLLGTGPDPWNSTANPSEPGECSELLKPAELLPLPERFEVWLREQQTPKPATQGMTSEIVHTTTTGTPSNLRDRVYRYLDAADPAIQGQNGSGTTFRVLSNTYHGFNLTEPQLRDAAKYYNRKCNPPWSDGELDHKVHDVIEKSTPPNGKVRGELLTEPLTAPDYGVTIDWDALEANSKKAKESQAMTDDVSNSDTTVPPAETTTTTGATQWQLDVMQANEKVEIANILQHTDSEDADEVDGNNAPVSDEVQALFLHNVPAMEDDPYPVDAFPEPLNLFIWDTAKAMDRYPQMVGTFLLPALAAAIGNTRVANILTKWREPTILWGAVIAPPSEMKTPVMKRVYETFQQYENQERMLWDQQQEQYELDMETYATARKDSIKNGTPPPARPKHPTDNRIIVGDITREKLAYKLASAPRGLLMWRDELSGWIQELTRYDAKGGMAFWNECYTPSRSFCNFANAYALWAALVCQPSMATFSYGMGI